MATDPSPRACGATGQGGNDRDRRDARRGRSLWVRRGGERQRCGRRGDRAWSHPRRPRRGGPQRGVGRYTKGAWRRAQPWQTMRASSGCVSAGAMGCKAMTGTHTSSSRGPRRLRAPAVGVVVCMALWGCGKDDRAGSVTATVPAGVKSGLGPERFKALDRIFASLPPLHVWMQRAPSANGFAPAARPAREACAAVSQVDPALGARGRYCSLGLDLDEQVVVFNGCYRAVTAHEPIAGESACQRSFSEIPSLARRMQREARRSDRAIRRLALTPACRRALSSRAQTYELLDAYVRVFEALASVRSRADSPTDLREGLRRLRTLAATVPPIAQLRQ